MQSYLPTGGIEGVRLTDRMVGMAGLVLWIRQCRGYVRGGLLLYI